MITSPANPKVKYVRRLQSDRRFRHREQAFVIEGSRWLSEVSSDRTPKLILYTHSWLDLDNNTSWLAETRAPAAPVSEEMMRVISNTESPPGILAVVEMQPVELPCSPDLILIADQVTNPGNLGTMLRTAGAAGVDGVLLGPGCVDPYNPKVLRGGMGAHLRLPIYTMNWLDIARLTSDLSVWIAAADGEATYTAIDWRRPSALVIGSEARGAGEDATQLASGSARIPMSAATESLNAAMAAAVILFEIRRQRMILS